MNCPAGRHVVMCKRPALGFALLAKAIFPSDIPVYLSICAVSSFLKAVTTAPSSLALRPSHLAPPDSPKKSAIPTPINRDFHIDNVSETACTRGMASPVSVARRFKSRTFHKERSSLPNAYHIFAYIAYRGGTITLTRTTAEGCGVNTQTPQSQIGRFRKAR